MSKPADQIAKILLTSWAARVFPDKPPSIKTLRNWARAGKIIPMPVKVGREYRVEENATYINWNDPASVRAANEPKTTQ